MPKRKVEPVWSWLPGERETLEERCQPEFMIVDFEKKELRILNAKEMNELCHLDDEEKTNEDS